MKKKNKILLSSIGVATVIGGGILTPSIVAQTKNNNQVISNNNITSSLDTNQNVSNITINENISNQLNSNISTLSLDDNIDTLSARSNVVQDYESTYEDLNTPYLDCVYGPNVTTGPIAGSGGVNTIINTNKPGIYLDDRTPLMHQNPEDPFTYNEQEIYSLFTNPGIRIKTNINNYSIQNFPTAIKFDASKMWANRTFYYSMVGNNKQSFDDLFKPRKDNWDPYYEMQNFINNVVVNNTNNFTFFDKSRPIPKFCYGDNTPIMSNENSLFELGKNVSVKTNVLPIKVSEKLSIVNSFYENAVTKILDPSGNNPYKMKFSFNNGNWYTFSPRFIFDFKPIVNDVEPIDINDLKFSEDVKNKVLSNSANLDDYKDIFAQLIFNNTDSFFYNTHVSGYEYQLNQDLTKVNNMFNVINSGSQGNQYISYDKNSDILTMKITGWFYGGENPTGIVKLTGFNRKDTTAINNEIHVDKPTVSANNYPTSDIQTILNQNISSIFDSVPSNTTTTVSSSDVDYSQWAQGKIIVNKVTLSNAYQSNTTVHNKTFDTHIVISGFKSNWSSGEINSTINNQATLNYGNVLPQTLVMNYINNTSTWQDDFKNALINSGVFKTASAPGTRQITANDIQSINFNSDVLNNTFNNADGTLEINVTFKPGTWYTNGTLNTDPVTQTVTVKGFLAVPNTTLTDKVSTNGNPPSNIVNISLASNKFTTDVNKKQIQDAFDNGTIALDQFVNNPITNSLFTNQQQKNDQNYISNTKMVIDSIDNTSHITEGYIVVKAHIDNYNYNGKYYANSPSDNGSNYNTLTFALGGFKNKNDNASDFTTNFVGGQLNNVNTILPQFAADSQNHSSDNQIVINAIKAYLIDGHISGLPQTSVNNISQSDLTVKIDNFDNFKGSVTATVTLGNSKGWDSGVIQKQITKQVTFTGLKTVQGTKYILNEQLPIQAPYDQKLATDFSLDDATNFLNSSADIKNKLFSNLPSDATIWVKDGSLNANAANGTVSLQVAPSVYYDITTGKYTVNNKDNCGWDTLTISGFNNNSSLLTTTVSGTIQLTGMDNVLAQDATQDKYWEGSIKAQVFNALSTGNYVHNLANGASSSVLNSTNMDIFCRPNKDSTDASIIGSKIFWNNNTGTITVRLQIKNNLAWKDGVAQPTMDFPLTITGFKKVGATTQKNTSINVGEYNGVDWSKKLATDFANNINGFINANKNEIYNNLPDGATLSVEGTPNIVNKDGTITIQVNTNQYYSSSNGTEFVNAKMNSPITLTLTGFTNVGNNGSIFTTQVNGTKLNNVDSILPDYLTNDLQNVSAQQKQQYLDQINQAIVDSGCVVNLAQDKTLKPTDIELTNIVANNKEGSITATVKIKNGVAQTNGDSNPNFEQTAVKFTGFKTMQPTSSKPSAGVLLPNSTSTLPFDANQQQIQDYLNQHKDEVFNNLPPNATITVSSLNKNDPSLSEKGQVSVSVSVSPTYDENGNLTNNALSNEVTINGFKPSTGVDTIIVNKNITIDGLNNKKADDVVKSQDNDVKNIIINYLANNENIFSNLVTGADLTPSDISIGQLTNPINVDGTLVVNDVTINNNKAFINGLPSPSVNLGSITVGGFEKQNPSTWLNTNENPFQFNEFKDIKIADATNEKLQPILQSHINQILSNAPANATLSVNIDQGSIDIAKGTLRATVSTSSYYDNQGNLQTDNHSQVYTFGFFIKDTNSTSIGQVNLPSSYNTKIGSETISSDTINLANDIKQEIINNNLINNSYPLAGPVGDKFKVEIVPNSANNLNGTVQAKVTLDDGYYMENGTVVSPSKPITITVGGFKKLQPTNVDNSTINNAIDKKTNVNEIVNNPQTVSNIQNAVSNALTDSMFPNNKPAADQIKVTTSNLNPANGSFDVNVEIPGEYVDSEGNIQPGPFKTTITVNGCKSDTSTTSVVGGNLQNCNTIIATELNASTSSEVKNQIKQAMLDANLIKNTTSGKTFTTDNFDIQFVDGTANNLDGSISVNVTINSGYACEGGNQLNTNKTYSNIKLTGFEVLKPTTISNDAVNNVIDKNLNPNQIASDPNQINKIKDAVNNALTNDMFPNGNKPSADQIKVEITNQNPADGSFNVHVTIPGPTVNSDGTINNNGTEIDIPVSGCKTDTNTTSAVNGTISGCENIIASQITSNDYSKIIDGIIANGNIIVQTSSSKDQPISANDIEISVDPSTVNNLDGSVQVTITVKNGYASKNGVIQNDPVTLAPVKITGFKTLTPTNIDTSNIKVDSNSNANQFENNPNAMNDIANQVANNLNPNMFPDGNKPTADKIHAEIVNTDPANGTVDVKVTIDVPQYVDKNGNIQNGPFEQTVTIKGFKKDTTTTSVLGSKNLSGLENLIPSDVNNQNQDAINQIKQAIVDDYNNNKNSTNPNESPLLQNLNGAKLDITVNDIDVNIVGNNNLGGSIQAIITIKNDYACENGKPLPSKEFAPVTIGGLKQLSETVIGEIPSPIGDQTSAKDLANSGSLLGQAVQDGIINNTDPSMFPNGLESGQINVFQPTNIDNVHGTIQVPVEINAPWVDANGNIHNLDGTDPFKQTITLVGLKNVPEQSWLDNNWWIILVAVAGSCLLLLVLLLIVKKAKERNSYLYGY